MELIKFPNFEFQQLNFNNEQLVNRIVIAESRAEIRAQLDENQVSRSMTEYSGAGGCGVKTRWRVGVTGTRLSIKQLFCCLCCAHMLYMIYKFTPFFTNFTLKQIC